MIEPTSVPWEECVLGSRSRLPGAHALSALSGLEQRYESQAWAPSFRIRRIALARARLDLGGGKYDRGCSGKGCPVDP